MEIYVGIVITDSQERIYLIKEKDKNLIGKNRWNIPGGSVEKNETLIDAAVRETKEETGYDIKINSLLGCYLCEKNSVSWIYIVFSGKLTSQKCRRTDPDVKKGKWFEKKTFLHLNSSELVHPDMQLVYNIVIENKGLDLQSVKYINYNIQ